ncbi:MAG TPA: hypothetical protein VN603_07320 [Candidatus Acidoferrales bacterium]|nr:hypothetical protein [Candidatus Acidoferrales bacterium]
MLDLAAALADVGSILLIGGAVAPAPRRARAYLVGGAALLAIGAALTGIYFAAACAVVALVITIAKLVEVGRLMTLVGSDVSSEHLLQSLRP